jgi:hypothetical protein
MRLEAGGAGVRERVSFWLFVVGGGLLRGGGAVFCCLL